jgi:hypothetical protein
LDAGPGPEVDDCPALDEDGPGPEAEPEPDGEPPPDDDGPWPEDAPELGDDPPYADEPEDELELDDGAPLDDDDPEPDGELDDGPLFDDDFGPDDDDPEPDDDEPLLDEASVAADPALAEDAPVPEAGLPDDEPPEREASADEAAGADDAPPPWPDAPFALVAEAGGPFALEVGPPGLPEAGSVAASAATTTSIAAASRSRADIRRPHPTVASGPGRDNGTTARASRRCTPPAQRPDGPTRQFPPTPIADYSSANRADVTPLATTPISSVERQQSRAERPRSHDGACALLNNNSVTCTVPSAAALRSAVSHYELSGDRCIWAGGENAPELGAISTHGLLRK